MEETAKIEYHIIRASMILWLFEMNIQIPPGAECEQIDLSQRIRG
jgi:hypothetical protein